MGASGKKLQGHGTRKKLNSPPAQTKDGGHGLPPHPLALRSGQRFTPRTGARRRPFQVVRVDRLRGRVQARRIDGQREPVSASAAGLLRTRSDGQGRYVQFVGFDTRRYETFATVVAIDGEGAATLVLPEWHPRRPVPLPARLLPPEARVPGAWLRCTADLSMGRAAWLNVADLRPCEDPGPERCHRPQLQLAAAAAPTARPDSGRGCGDIVLALPESGLERFPRCDGLLELYLADRPAGLGPCDRVYLERDGRIVAYLVVRTRMPRPYGDLVTCEPEPVALPRELTVASSPARGSWRWRWWSRELEEAAAEELTAALAAYDPEHHDPEAWRWAVG